MSHYLLWCQLLSVTAAVTTKAMIWSYDLSHDMVCVMCRKYSYYSSLPVISNEPLFFVFNRCNKRPKSALPFWSGELIKWNCALSMCIIHYHWWASMLNFRPKLRTALKAILDDIQLCFIRLIITAVTCNALDQLYKAWVQGWQWKESVSCRHLTL